MTTRNYAWEEGGDGTFSIRGVPIFELGTHRGFNYDEPWARRALRSFARLKKERGYLPPVILGHTSDEGEEKPAVGFVDRLRMVGSHLLADLVGIGCELFDQIRAGRWPYRSVEVFDKDAQITALALLGGTPPYMKTAPLHFAEDGSAGVWISGEHLPRLEENRSNRRDGRGGEHNRPTSNGGNMQTETRQFSQQDVDRLIEAARAEERSHAEEKFRETKSRLERLEAEARTAQRRAFRADLQQLGYSPAILDSDEMSALVSRLMDRNEPIRFGEEEVAPLALLGCVLRIISERASDGRLFVDAGERAHSGTFHTFADTVGAPDDEAVARFGERVDPVSVRRYAHARELAESEGITFRDALQRVTAGNGIPGKE